MNWDIRYTKDMQAKAAAKGKGLAAVGYMGGGRAEACMFMDDDQIYTLWRFAHNLNKGMDPQSALDETLASLAAAKERIASRTPADSPTD